MRIAERPILSVKRTWTLRIRSPSTTKVIITASKYSRQGRKDPAYTWYRAPPGNNITAATIIDILPQGKFTTAVLTTVGRRGLARHPHTIDREHYHHPRVGRWCRIRETNNRVNSSSCSFCKCPKLKRQIIHNSRGRRPKWTLKIPQVRVAEDEWMN